jgi:hypothetical protein
MLRRMTCLFEAAFFWGLAVALFAGCGPSPSASNKTPPAEIHGEPITPVKNSSTTVAIAVPIPAASISAPITKNPEPMLLAENSDYIPVGFDKLASYHFETDDTPYTNQDATADKANQQIPDTIKNLSDKKISIKGFMLPLKVSDGVVTEFLIMKDQSMCCFGTTPKINEWVSVKTVGAGVKPIMDQPVSMLGTLHVGALRENGYLVGIYQMDGDKLVGTDN